MRNSSASLDEWLFEIVSVDDASRLVFFSVNAVRRKYCALACVIRHRTELVAALKCNFRSTVTSVLPFCSFLFSGWLEQWMESSNYNKYLFSFSLNFSPFCVLFQIQKASGGVKKEKFIHRENCRVLLSGEIFFIAFPFFTFCHDPTLRYLLRIYGMTANSEREKRGGG